MSEIAQWVYPPNFLFEIQISLTKKKFFLKNKNKTYSKKDSSVLIQKNFKSMHFCN